MAAVSNVRYAAWEDRIVASGKDSVWLQWMDNDPKLKVVGGFIRVRGEKDEDNGFRSDIVESVGALRVKFAGFRLKSTEGMKLGDRVWVSITIQNS